MLALIEVHLEGSKYSDIGYNRKGLQPMLLQVGSLTLQVDAQVLS